MHSEQFRPLSMDELEFVTGGEGFFKAAGEFLSGLVNGPSEDPTPYVNAFLKGVEEGKRKGQKT